MAERVSEVHIKAGDGARPISPKSARRARTEIGDFSMAWSVFQSALRSKVPDPSVVG